MRRFLLLLPLLLAVSPAAAKEREEGSFLRGICYTSHEFQNQSEKELVAWVQENRINLVVVDFFLLGHSYGWTDLDKIARLVKRLKKEGITVLADYRPSTGKPGVASPGEQPDLCLSTPEIRANITGWGLHILEKVPGIDILTIYNPMPRFERNPDCPECKRIGERALLELFFGEWSKAIRAEHPGVRLGAVFVAGEALYGPIREHLDVFCPFCSLIAEGNRESVGPGIMKKVAADMRGLQKHGPVIPLVKLYWKEATRNTTEDILAAMQEAKEEGLDGFFLWYRSLLTGEVDAATPFDLPDYDLARIEARYRELAEPPAYPEVFAELRARHLELLRELGGRQQAYLSEGGDLGPVVEAARALLEELKTQKERVDGVKVARAHRGLRDAHRRVLVSAVRDLERFVRAAGQDAEAAVREQVILGGGAPREQLALLKRAPDEELPREDARRMVDVLQAQLDRARAAGDEARVRRIEKALDEARDLLEACADGRR